MDKGQLTKNMRDDADTLADLMRLGKRSII
jgi:hypothetical protein